MSRRFMRLIPIFVVLLLAATLSTAVFAHGLIRPTTVHMTHTTRTAPAQVSGSSCTINRWSVSPTLSPSTAGNVFNAVASVASNDVWAVGYSDVPQQPLAEHFDGNQWSSVALPLGSASGGVLNGVALLATNDVWAVGNQSETSGEATLIEHWNGTKWNLVASPNGGTFGSTLAGITAIASDDIWAVGYYYHDDQGERAVLIEHWNGTSWSIVPSANTGDTDSILHSIAAVSSSDVWAVGYGISATTSGQALIERWNGTVWNVVASPTSGMYAELFAAAVSNTGAVWAVGATTTVSGSAIPLAEQWTGSAWTIVSSTQTGGVNSGFLGVGIAPNGGIWAVGYYFMSDEVADSHTLVERWNGTTFYPVADATAPGQNGILYGIVAPANNFAWVAGGLGKSINPTQTLAESYVAPMRGIFCP